jgi:hypothetical protein
MCDQAGHGFLSFPNTYKGIFFFFKSDVKALSSWYEELKVANSAFHNDVHFIKHDIQGCIFKICRNFTYEVVNNVEN